MAVLYGSGNWNSDNAWTADPGNSVPDQSEKDLRPGNDDEADIGSRTDKTVQLTNAAGSIDKLTIHLDAALAVLGGSLSVNSGAVNQGGISVEDGGTLDIGGGLVNAAGSTLDVAGVGSDFTVDSLSNLGAISVTDHGLFTVNDFGLGTLSGRVTVSRGGVLEASVDRIGAGAYLSVSGALSHIGGSSGGGLGGIKANSGTLHLTNTSVDTDSYFSNKAGASLVVAAQAGHRATLDFAYGGRNDGAIIVKGSSVVEVHRGLINHGTFSFIGNAGVVDVFNLATFDGRINGKGHYIIEHGAWLTFLTSVVSGSEVQFDGDGGKLFLHKTSGFHADITGFSVGNTIDIVAKTVTGLDYDDGTLLVSLKSGGMLTEKLDGDFNGLAAVYDRNGGTNILGTGPVFALTKGTDIVDAHMGMTIRASASTLGARDNITVNDAGNNTLALTGGGHFDLTDISGFQTLKLRAGHDYTVLAGPQTVGAGNTMMVDASNLRTTDRLVLTGTAEASGHFNVIGGAGADTISGGNLGDRLAGGRGDDVLRGGGGHDTFVIATGDGADTIADFDAQGGSSDVLGLSGLATIHDFTDLKNNHLSTLNGDVVIDGGNGDKIVLVGVQINDLSTSNFNF